MRKPLAREPAAWTVAWSTTSSACARGWSASYVSKGYSRPFPQVPDNRLGGKQDVWCLVNGPVSNACVSCTAFLMPRNTG
jgi:hypothetical protein